MYLFPDYFVLHISDYFALDRLITMIVVGLLMIFIAVWAESVVVYKLETWKEIEPIVTLKSERSRILKLYCVTVLISFDVLLCIAMIFTVPISIFQWHIILVLIAILSELFSFSEFFDWFKTKNNYARREKLSNNQKYTLLRYSHIKTVAVLISEGTKIPIFLLIYDYLTEFPKLQHFIFN